ncbi:hypothetical protein V2G26_000525 [Clonostachys chloroleuca]
MQTWCLGVCVSHTLTAQTRDIDHISDVLSEAEHTSYVPTYLTYCYLDHMHTHTYILVTDIPLPYLYLAAVLVSLGPADGSPTAIAAFAARCVSFSTFQGRSCYDNGRGR